MFQRLSRETRGEISTSGVHFNERRSPTGEMLDDLSSHVSQPLVWVGSLSERWSQLAEADGHKVKRSEGRDVERNPGPRLFAV